VWNLDETGCFWHALPEKGFGEKGKECKGGKKAKQRVTIAFIVNATGESEGKPIVIGSQKTQHVFKTLIRKGFQSNISIKAKLGCLVKSWTLFLKRLIST